MRFLQIRGGQLGLDLGCRNLQFVLSGLGWFFFLLLVLFDDTAQIRFNRVVSFGVVFVLRRFRFIRWECEPSFPSSFFVRGAWAAGEIGMLHDLNCRRERVRLAGRGTSITLVFMDVSAY